MLIAVKEEGGFRDLLPPPDRGQSGSAGRLPGSGTDLIQGQASVFSGRLLDSSQPMRPDLLSGVELSANRPLNPDPRLRLRNQDQPGRMQNCCQRRTGRETSQFISHSGLPLSSIAVLPAPVKTTWMP